MAEQKLNRGLKNRHLQMIALGTAVGTGLFYGSTSTIALVGPAVSLSYLIGGVIIFFVVRMLGEMSVEEPVAGAFSYFANKYWGKFPGFLAGWNYWVLYILAAMFELTAVGIYVNYWFEDFPKWISALVCLVFITFINSITVRAYGEIEFWMSLIKISAIVFMIIFGSYLILSDPRPFPENFSNLWIHGGFLPNGIEGLMLSMVPVILSFGGVEMIGITAGETENPEKNIPQAVNQIIYRILIFYVGTMLVLMTLWPWNEVGTKASPFVQIFENVGVTAAANLLNFIVLTAAISVYNSALYSNSRMLYSMAENSDAPKFFTKLSKNKVPINGLLVSSAITLLAVFFNYLLPEKIFMYLMSLITTSFIICWGIIIITHLKFRKYCNANGIVPKFKCYLYPYANYVCLIFMALVIFFMTTMEDMLPAVILMPVYLAVIAICYKLKN